MFVQYLDRLLWQPQGHPDEQTLAQELDEARRKIARYEKRIMSLNVELKAYRRFVHWVYTKRLLSGFAKASNHSPPSPPCRNNATVVAPLPKPPLITSVRATTPDNPPSRQSDWSVVYNPDVERSVEVKLARTFKYSDLAVRCVRFSSDGKYMAIGLQWNGKTHIYDMDTLKEKCVLADFSTKEQMSIWAVDFSPDSKYVATGGSDNSICIWKIKQKRLCAKLRGHRGDVFTLSFSPDGRFLVSGSYDDSVRTWRLRDGSSWELLELDNAFGYFTVCFSPDGQYIAAANSDKALRIWHTRTAKLVEKWTAHAESVMVAAFTSDGKGLVSGGNDFTIKYWDLSSIGISQPRTEIFKLKGHTESVRSVAFLPDRQLLLSGSNDHSVRIWNADTARLECTLRGHKHRVVSVDCSQVGNYLASGSLDGEVIVWKYVNT